MIALECKPTKTMLQLEALKDRRLSPTHLRYNDIVMDYNSKLKGHLGEKSLIFYLDLLPDDKYYIFFGLRLKYKNFYFQIDVLIVCARFILVTEAKNVDAEINFDSFNQCNYIKNGKRTRRKNPVLQAKLQAQKLKEWLRENFFPEVPIEYLFVNTNENTTLTTVSGNQLITSRACNSECFIEKIENHSEYHKEEKLSPKELRKLKKVLLEKHTPEEIDILKEYNISDSDIIRKPQCPKCGEISMTYKYAKWWSCTKCGELSNTAHIAAINDYFLLKGSTITNAQLRWMLQINSLRVAGRILKSMNFPFTGKFKDRVYKAPTDLQQAPPEKAPT